MGGSQFQFILVFQPNPSKISRELENYKKVFSSFHLTVCQQYVMTQPVSRRGRCKIRSEFNN